MTQSYLQPMKQEATKPHLPVLLDSKTLIIFDIYITPAEYKTAGAGVS